MKKEREKIKNKMGGKKVEAENKTHNQNKTGGRNKDRWNYSNKQSTQKPDGHRTHTQTHTHKHTKI